MATGNGQACERPDQSDRDSRFSAHDEDQSIAARRPRRSPLRYAAVGQRGSTESASVIPIFPKTCKNERRLQHSRSLSSAAQLGLPCAFFSRLLADGSKENRTDDQKCGGAALLESGGPPWPGRGARRAVRMKTTTQVVSCSSSPRGGVRGRAAGRPIGHADGRCPDRPGHGIRPNPWRAAAAPPKNGARSEVRGRALCLEISALTRSG